MTKKAKDFVEGQVVRLRHLDGFEYARIEKCGGHASYRRQVIATVNGKPFCSHVDIDQLTPLTVEDFFEGQKVRVVVEDREGPCGWHTRMEGHLGQCGTVRVFFTAECQIMVQFDLPRTGDSFLYEPWCLEPLEPAKKEEEEETVPKFAVGQRVRIIGKEGTAGVWLSDMNAALGKVGRISQMRTPLGNGFMSVEVEEVGNYSYHTNSLELVKEEETMPRPTEDVEKEACIKVGHIVKLTHKSFEYGEVMKIKPLPYREPLSYLVKDPVSGDSAWSSVNNLTPLTRADFKAGQRVRVMQEDHGTDQTWPSSMNKTAGKEGIVRRVGWHKDRVCVDFKDPQEGYRYNTYNLLIVEEAAKEVDTQADPELQTFEEGDTVKVVRRFESNSLLNWASSMDATLGHVGIILSKSKQGADATYKIRFKDGDALSHLWTYLPGSLELVQPEEKFSVGDRVKVVKKLTAEGVLTWPSNMDKTLGQVGTIFGVSEEQPFSYYLEMKDGEHKWSYLAGSLELVSKAEGKGLKFAQEVKETVDFQRELDKMVKDLKDRDLDLVKGVEAMKDHTPKSLEDSPYPCPTQSQVHEYLASVGERNFPVDTHVRLIRLPVLGEGGWTPRAAFSSLWPDNREAYQELIEKLEPLIKKVGRVLYADSQGMDISFMHVCGGAVQVRFVPWFVLEKTTAPTFTPAFELW